MERLFLDVWNDLSTVCGKTVPHCDCPEPIFNDSLYFNTSYLDWWISEKNFAQEVIKKKIERVDILSTQAIDSKVLGVIPVTQLSHQRIDKSEKSSIDSKDKSSFDGDLY